MVTSDEIHFETPENIRVSYRAAGPGTRFVAWVVDNILLWFFTIAIAVPLLIVFGAAAEALLRGIPDVGESSHPGLYFLGIFWLLFSLGGLLYFGVCELFFHGQTLGKRQMKIRVVKCDGFALDPLAILVRTIFRVVDHLPLLWPVPLFTRQSQRLGDMVAGTVVVSDEQPQFAAVHDLANRKYADCRYHFNAAALGRLRPQDIEAVERVLERWASLGDGDRESLLDRIIKPLAARMQVDGPELAGRVQFLEDLLAAEYRRQHRQLG